jgi:hypothetical protein
MVNECPHILSNPDYYNYFLRFSSYISLKASDIFLLKSVLRGVVEPGIIKPRVITKDGYKANTWLINSRR